MHCDSKLYDRYNLVLRFIHITLTLTLKDVDEAKGTTDFKLTDVPVLDVGLGLGKALAGMQVFYKCNAVGIEVCPRMFAGSVHYLSYLEQKLGYLPIRPIKGDALKIDHFWKWMNYLLLVKRFLSKFIIIFNRTLN